MVAAVRANPATQADLVALEVFHGPRQRRLADYWFAALREGREVAEDNLPPLAQQPTDPDAMPAQSRWRDKDPAAALRLAACKDVVAGTAAKHQVVGQNLLAGDIVRRLAWRSVSPLTEPAVRQRLAELAARPWQIELLAAGLTTALAAGDKPAD